MSTAILPFIEEVALAFWQPLISYKSFPVDIDRVVALSDLRVMIVQLPNLSLSIIQRWIVQNNHAFPLLADDRLLHGFLLAHRGAGVVFVNGTDSPAERRFTVAHEIAHFLLDYQLPRQRFVDTFGEAVIAILDGDREPSLSERLQFITADIPSPFSSQHLDGHCLTAYDRHLVWQAEQRVDALATELLAPHKEVIQRIRLNSEDDFTGCIEEIVHELSTTFGLPSSISQAYGHYIAQSIFGDNTLHREWGIT